MIKNKLNGIMTIGTLDFEFYILTAVELKLFLHLKYHLQAVSLTAEGTSSSSCSLKLISFPLADGGLYACFEAEILFIITNIYIHIIRPRLKLER